MPRRYPLRPALALVLGLLLSTAVRGEDQIVTDRPDFVESSLTVGKGRFQVEASVAGIYDKEGSERQHLLGTPFLLRLGFAPDWELRLETAGYTHFHDEDPSVPLDETQSGFEDVALGLKWHTQDGEGARPSVAWLLHADFPIGSSDFRGHAVRPSLRASLEWELPASFGLGVMPGVVYDSREDGHRYTAGILGVVLGYNWTEQLRTFVEVAGRQLATPENGGNIVTYDVGIGWIFTPSMQVDAAVSFGANDHTPDLAWTVGFSVKF